MQQNFASLVFYILQGSGVTPLKCGRYMKRILLQISCRIWQWKKFENWSSTFVKVTNECI